jgi:hypothetical protein
VGVAPTKSVYSQIVTRIAQNAARLESFSPPATAYNAVAMIVMFQPENQ